MIASPSDVQEARDVVEDAVTSWNAAHARSKGLILQPWRWETSAVPVLGGHPQTLINSQGVDDSDIVFALFGGRLGSPTPDFVSGTVEEIDRAVGLGKPVHVYFSTEPLPNDIDTAQLDALRAFKSDMQARGLLGEYSNPNQLNHEVWKAIEHDIGALRLTQVDPPSGQSVGVDFVVQPQQEREITGVNPRGAPRYSTRHWLDITNAGSRDADEVTFETVGQDSPMHIVGTGGPTTIHRAQTRRLPVVFTMGGSDAPILRIRWTEDGEVREREFHVG
jgi:hypothetical protein